MIAPLVIDGPLARPIVNSFHRVYYAGGGWRDNTFLGYPLMQCPMDLHVYQEIVFRTRPKFIIQTGIAEGGSLLYLAWLLDLVGVPAGRVIGVDIAVRARAQTLSHPRIVILEGDSVSATILRNLEELTAGARGLVILDSDHAQGHVAAELAKYSRWVERDSYLVVEDTNINGHPVYSSFGPGPYEAAQAFLANTTDFVQDDACWRKNLFTHHTWLQRRSS